MLTLVHQRGRVVWGGEGSAVGGRRHLLHRLDPEPTGDAPETVAAGEPVSRKIQQEPSQPPDHEPQAHDGELRVGERTAAAGDLAEHGSGYAKSAREHAL